MIDTTGYKPLTALGRLAENCATSLKVASVRRDRGADDSYSNGEAVAYDNSHRIMKAELQRLRNLLQNGALTQADFGDDLPY